MSVMVSHLWRKLTCKDCERSLTKTGPYIGAVYEMTPDAYVFLCVPCAQRKVSA
jgi:RNase P subunit RPR2